VLRMNRKSVALLLFGVGVIAFVGIQCTAPTVASAQLMSFSGRGDDRQIVVTAGRGLGDSFKSVSVSGDGNSVRVTVTLERRPGTYPAALLFFDVPVTLASPLDRREVLDGEGKQVPMRASNPIATFEVPGSCSKETATRLVGDFFMKWNDRDANGAAGLFSLRVSFHDNVGGKQTMLTGRDALRRYLADRFVLEDRFSNVVADIPENPSPTRANPTVSFARSVGATMYRGNAKLVCVDDLLSDVVMSAE
jgi:hypothetical protein